MLENYGINIYNRDCLAAMRLMPDNAFDLAIVDPPYGIGWDNKVGIRNKTVKQTWDAQIPPPYILAN